MNTYLFARLHTVSCMQPDRQGGLILAHKCSALKGHDK